MQTAQQKNVTWHDICACADVPNNSGVTALIGDTQIALFSVGKEPQFFAISNYDPFSDAYVLARGIVGSIGESLVVASPIYKEHFNLATGECLEDADVVIDAYPVKIENERVYIAITN